IYGLAGRLDNRLHAGSSIAVAATLDWPVCSLASLAAKAATHPHRGARYAAQPAPASARCAPAPHRTNLQQPSRLPTPRPSCRCVALAVETLASPNTLQTT